MERGLNSGCGALYPEFLLNRRVFPATVCGRPRENMQTNHLALFPWCAASKGRLDPLAFGAWPVADHAACLRERLQVAKGVLNKFPAVGTVERLPVSLARIRDRSAALGVALLPPDALLDT
jgi:hypothetical protein